jgi:hypothetical protein
MAEERRLPSIGELQQVLRDQGMVMPFSRFQEVRPPGKTDDLTQGFEPGSRWHDVKAQEVYICMDATKGQAVWRQVATKKLT